jgi:HD-like signal output (HDOD) protein
MGGKSLKELIEEQLAADNLKLPVFNRVALELQRLKGAPNVGMDRISALIERDQALASRVLRVANSSFFGGLKKVDTVNRAVVRLGLERVTQLAMVASQVLAHASSDPLLGGYMQRLWIRSFACATGSRWVAEQSGYGARAEEAFLAGLLHDIGELFLLKVLEKIAAAAGAGLTMGESLVAEVLEAMHAELGGRLMLKWELPEQYARVAAHHHDPEFEETDVLLVIVRLLDVACLKLAIGQPGDGDIVLAATPEAQLLGLKDIKLAQLEVMLEDAVREAGELAGAA